MVDAADRVWVDAMPAAYDRWLVPAVFRPFAVDLARRVAVHTPRNVLELAAGTGVLTRELLAVTDSVTATDLNAAMVDLGRSAVPGATWEQADAANLPFGDAVFDVVSCQFGVMFFPDKPAAFAEARRVLTPGGRLVLNTWDALDTHDFQSALVSALERLFPDDPPTFIAAVPHGYRDVDVVLADLETGGLHCTAVATVTLDGRAESAADLAVGYCTGTPLRGQIEARADLAATAEAVAREMTVRLGAGPVVGSMSAILVEATRADQ